MFRWTGFVLAGLISTLSIAAVTAEPPAEMDAKLRQGLFQVLERGTEIFNRGDHSGCLRLYQGALIAADSVLGHRPDLQGKIQKGLRKTEGMRAADAAFELRRVIDELRVELVGMKKPLWDRLGGEPAVTAVIDDFVARAAGNPKVNFTRKGTANEWEASPANVARLKKRLVQLVSAVSGGPLKYEGRDMKAAHQGMKITSAEFDALAADLKASLDKFKVPAELQTELLTIIASTKKDIVEKP